MAITAVVTEWDREVTDKIFVMMKIKQAQRGMNLVRYDHIPDSGNGLSVFIENIEKFSKKDIMKKFFYTSRPRDNIIFYTCKRLESVQKPLLYVTDFVFYPVEYENGKVKILIFRHGDWFSRLKDDIGKDYLKTYYFDFKKVKNWEQYLGEKSVKIIKNELKVE